jgi:hypothetical protein
MPATRDVSYWDFSSFQDAVDTGFGIGNWCHLSVVLGGGTLSPRAGWKCNSLEDTQESLP